MLNNLPHFVERMNKKKGAADGFSAKEVYEEGLRDGLTCGEIGRLFLGKDRAISRGRYAIPTSILERKDIVKEIKGLEPIKDVTSVVRRGRKPQFALAAAAKKAEAKAAKAESKGGTATATKTATKKTTAKKSAAKKA